MRSEDYLLDSNCFMTAARQYYARDFAPGFWRQLEGVMGHKDVLLLDIVREEIMNGGDDLATWLKELKGVHLLQRNDVEVFKQYTDKVLPHIGNCGFYKQNAIKRWHECRSFGEGWRHRHFGVAKGEPQPQPTVKRNKNP